MNRRDLYRLSVFLAVIGLTAMYFSHLYLDLETVEIGSIEKSWNGRNVIVNGTVTDFSRSGGHAFYDLNDSTGEIAVVDFDSGYSLEKGEEAVVTGHVSLYHGQLEVIAKEVQK